MKTTTKNEVELKIYSDLKLKITLQIYEDNLKNKDELNMNLKVKTSSYIKMTPKMKDNLKNVDDLKSETDIKDGPTGAVFRASPN